MKKSVAGGIMQNAPIRGRQAVFEANRFIPNDPSDSLEYSASDFAIAQFARAQGDTATYDSAMTRAQYWRSSFNSESSFVHPRAADGTWAWPLNPAQEAPFVEGNAAQYTWMVPHNLGALITLMGGPATAIQRLDHHFTELNGGLVRPYFYIGNEPEHGVPWVYHFAGKPSGTMDAVRRVMAESFTTGAGGLPGNDDLGATSAWYVWAALGMYPPTPGADTLALHGPSFPSILVDRPGGDLQITGGSATDRYVQSVRLNGGPVNHSWLRYGDLAGGGTLSYTMGSGRGVWGTAPSDWPPSFTDGAPQPPPAPDLGPNLALNRPTAASAACGPGEDGGKAVDGLIRGNSKWCSSTAPRFLAVDLGSAQNVASFVVKHAGSGAENTAWNTAGFSISTSTDNVNWSPAVSVSGSRSSRTYHPVTPRTARYVRLDIAAPGADAAARIYEFEVYGRSGAADNLALNRQATADSSCAPAEGPEKAVNGSASGGWTDKWCSKGANRWLQVDLGGSLRVGSFTVRHAAGGGEDPGWNTRDFDIRVSADGSTWSTPVSVRGNTAGVTTHPVSVTARYVRLDVLTPTSNGDDAARIYELEVRP
jgi:hypothetical protein